MNTLELTRSQPFEAEALGHEALPGFDRAAFDGIVADLEGLEQTDPTFVEALNTIGRDKFSGSGDANHVSRPL